MAVAKDPAIKLFGKTISLPDSTQFSDDSESVDNGSCLLTKAETDECKHETSGIIDEAASLECCKGKQPQMPNAKTHQEESHGSGEPKAPFKRPDKVLPCPRCNSSDTKFCYFNNYNVNQPRYFCKSCQRYWTAGGTVRNVPVGAGRRRNKHLASQYRQIIASSDGPTTLTETPESGNHQILSCEESSSSCATSSPSEMVLKFGPESPQCDSMPTILSQRQMNGCSDQASLPTGSLPATFGARAIKNEFPMQTSLYHYALPQIATLGPNSNSTVPMTVPGLQFVPASYWNCIPVLVAGSGNVSLALPNGCASPPFFSSGSGLQVLGKHSRGSNTATEETSKALRIHNLDEA